MTETLLFLNGQPVIFTSDGTESLVQSNSPLSSGAQSQAVSQYIKDIKEELYEPHVEGEDASMPVENRMEEGLASNVASTAVQVQVDGKEVPGFMLANQNVRSVNTVVGHSIPSQGSSYDLISSIKSECGPRNEETTENETAEFLQLHDQPAQTVLSKDSNFTGEGEGSCGSEVFALGNGSELLPQTQVEGNSMIGNGLGSTLGLQNIVRLPLMSSNVDSVAQSVAGTNPDGEQQTNLNTFVAIIQGEDGNTQTVELSPEEACRLNLLSGSGTTQQAVHQSPIKVEDAGPPHTSVQTQVVNQMVKMEGENEFPGRVSPGVMQMDSVGGNVSSEASGSDADVSLEPFLLIPEYGADGSISMLRIHGSDPEPQQKSEMNPVSFNSQQVEPSHVTEKSPPPETTQMYPCPSQNVHKITIPPSTAQPVKRSSNKHKDIDWKTVTPRFRSLPRVPGSMYLRDIAKRTKFRNLTSFLNTKQSSQKASVIEKEPEVSEASIPQTHTITQPSTYHITVPGLPNATAKISIPGLISSSTSNLISSSTSGISRASSMRLVPNQTSSQVMEAKATPLKLENVPIRLSLQPAHTTPTIRTGRLSALPREPEPSSGRALTIKVSTGPINGSVATSTTSASSSQSAIRCAESPESVAGASQPTPDSPSLTSIVYCSSGGDDTPFTVHLPGGDNTKPLGSSENPIQLVQQGNTFQALQPVQERQLQQITSLLQQRRITAPPTTHHDEIYDPKTNMKIVYKVVYPEDIVHLNDDDDDNDDIIWEDSPDDSHSEKRRGRKPKDWRKAKLADEGDDVDVEILEEREGRKNHISRTRSGRISRPPRHMMKDFKHLHPINFNDDDKDKDAPSIGYSDYNVQNQVESEEKPIEPVIFELPPRKKREVPPLTRLRYTCLTCGKLYMGRIEAHYRKFPDHRRERPLITSEIQQSYSTIKALSDTVKPSGEEGGEVNKSVLSPTPGTQASETSGEPSLPMETLTTRPLEADTSPHIKNEPSSEVPEFIPMPEIVPVKPARGRGRGRRGRRGRGRGGRFGALGKPPSSSTKPPPAPPPSAISMLEKILGGYSGEEILQAVGRRLLETLSPWQLLCFKAKRLDDKDELQSWQGRVQYLEQLLQECKEEFNKELKHLPDPVLEGQLVSRPLALTSAPEVLKDEVEDRKLSQEEGSGGLQSTQGAGMMANMNFESAGTQESIANIDADVDNVQITNILANALGVTSGFYKLRKPNSPSKAASEADPSPALGEKGNVAQQPEPQQGTKHKLERDDMTALSPIKRMRMNVMEHEKGGKKVTISGMVGSSEEDRQQMETCVSNSEANRHDGGIDKPLDRSGQRLPLSPYAITPQISPISSLTSTPAVLQTSLPSASSTINTSAGSTTLSTVFTASSFNLPLNGDSGADTRTTLTESQTAPCVTVHTSAMTSTTASLPIEVASFTSQSNSSVPVISSCMQMPTMEASLVTTSTLSQVAPMQQMPMGDLDITADDLPRLLSEGTGLVVGAGTDGTDACDAPKLLDTSGDTTDLSEMLFKLQEVTASIGQTQDPNLEQPVYQGPIMASNHQLNGDGTQMMTSQSMSAQSDSALTTQGFNPMAQPLITYSSSTTSPPSTQPSMPLLTFSGALDSDTDFPNSTPSGIGQQPISSSAPESVAKPQQTDGSAQDVSITQPQISLGDERERIGLGFTVSEFEELLKR
ncbi:uncharacterized protein LOC122248622 isoform X2 [Penaeus japonicus]|uniref:uncharacterized protein LOC122248622 isoform X2 n=1 Tax=Penaeus japonicus TaxID=27405 RepID=UPI001C7110D7|nr:uncharacterized protein LOC122248622 isoform X2 [Penaeus japonicus]